VPEESKQTRAVATAMQSVTLQKCRLTLARSIMTAGLTITQLSRSGSSKRLPETGVPLHIQIKHRPT